MKLLTTSFLSLVMAVGLVFLFSFHGALAETVREPVQAVLVLVNELKVTEA